MPIAFADRTNRPRAGQGRSGHVAARRLTDATVNDLAEEMCIPEGLFRAVIERSLELSRVLARRYRAPTCTA